MPEPEVQLGMRPSGNQPPPADPPADPPPDDGTEPDAEDPTPPEPTAAELQARLDRTEMLLTGEREQAKFWRDQARAGTTHVNTAPPTNGNGGKKQPSVLANVNILEAMADPERFETEVLDPVIRARGYVTRDEAAAITDSKAQEIGKLSAYYQRNPELSDPGSAIYKATLAARGWVDQQPEYANVTDAGKQLLALQIGEREIVGRKEVDTLKATAERTRQTRIARQTGPTGGGRASTAGADELTPEQKQVARSFGITEEQYAKHARQGVTMMRQPGGGGGSNR